MKIRSIKPNYKSIGKVAVLTYSSGIISLVSLKYVPYVLRLISKTCKPISVAISKKIYGKPIPNDKIKKGMYIIVGSAIFMYDPTKLTNNKYYMLGVTYLLTALTFDGITGAIEDKYLKNKDLNPAVTMYNIHGVRLIISVPIILYWKLYYELVSIITTSWKQLLYISFTNPIAQLCLFYSLSRFGAYDTLIITTIRKAVSIAVSFFIFSTFIICTSHTRGNYFVLWIVGVYA